MTNMGFSRLDRKMALLKIGMNQRRIAEALGIDASLVSHVLAGRRWMGTDSRKIMNFISEKVGVPVAEFFPGSERRHGGGSPLANRDGEPTESAAA
jgi:transcriptional regulator with XRE-family HTH domain